MRTASATALISVLLLAGCQTPNGGLDWRRMGNLATGTVMAGGGLLLGGPAGAAAGFGIGSNLFEVATRPSAGSDSARQGRATFAQRPPKAQPSSPAAHVAARTAPAPPAPEADTPRSSSLPATASGQPETETIGI
jgi:hypothetical protein